MTTQPSRAERIEAALRAMRREPFGCAWCDSGLLRNPEKQHADDCAFAMASSALALPPDAPAVRVQGELIDSAQPKRQPDPKNTDFMRESILRLAWSMSLADHLGDAADDLFKFAKLHGVDLEPFVDDEGCRICDLNKLEDAGINSGIHGWPKETS